MSKRYASVLSPQYVNKDVRFFCRIDSRVSSPDKGGGWSIELAHQLNDRRLEVEGFT